MRQKQPKKKVAKSRLRAGGQADPYRRLAREHRKASKVRDERAHKLVKQEVEVAPFTEVRLNLEKECERILWGSVPEMAGALVAGLRATRATTYGGAIHESEVPDHFMRMQAADRIAKLTVGPIFEDREMRQQIIIYSAIGGVYADRLNRARARVKARGVVPLPDLSEVLTPSRVKIAAEEEKPHE